MVTDYNTNKMNIAEDPEKEENKEEAVRVNTDENAVETMMVDRQNSGRGYNQSTILIEDSNK